MRKKEIFLDYLLVALGSLLLALGLNLFLTPMKLSTGGISSIGTMLLHLFRIPLSVTNLVLNAVLFLFGYRYVGKASVIKTLAGILLLSLFLQLTSNMPSYGEDLFMATIAGGILAGGGVGLVIRREGSTGGSDFAALVLNRFFPHISVATLILVIDCAIIAVSGLVFRSLTVTFYSVVSLFLATRVSDAILSMGSLAKSIYVASPKAEEISENIMKRFERGVTGIYSKGMYSGKDSLMLLCMVSPRELPKLVHMVRSVDRRAFIIISDAREVVGEGFREETPYDRINPR